MADRLTPESIEQDFSAQIGRYRTRTLRTWGLLIIVSIVALVLGSLHLPALVVYMLGAGLALCALRLLVLYFKAALQCPNCHQGLELAIDDHCPACGSTAERIVDGLPRTTRCAACKAPLSVDRVNGRLWTIRFCTFCGVRLSDVGI